MEIFAGTDPEIKNPRLYINGVAVRSLRQARNITKPREKPTVDITWLMYEWVRKSFDLSSKQTELSMVKGP